MDSFISEGLVVHWGVRLGGGVNWVNNNNCVKEENGWVGAFRGEKNVLMKIK